ncbi:MBL fold metallo-hydrolase [Lacinutrix salivirga]
MINIKKTFYSIGQGCFYSEKIYFDNEVKTIVYDCGSENGKSPNKNRLEKEIQQSGLNTIDFLIISHFHADHINGIDELKKNCIIKNVIIPKIDALDIAFYLGTGNTVSELLLNPTSYFRGSNNSDNPNIIVVDSEGEENQIDDLVKIPNRISQNSNIPVLKFDNRIIWILRFYIDKRVFKNDNRTDEQKKIIRETLSITDYEKNKTELIAAYKALSKKDINLTTMSMISTPTNNHPFFHRHDYPISAMNGDILLSDENRIKDYVEHFSDFINNSVHFHIPHHGSHKNLCRPINEWQIESGIIMSGYENKYGHPSGIILRKFKDSNIPLKKLTQFDRNFTKTYRLWY